MKSVLISIQPKWCELIVSGKKTVEARKTRPKIETPFKVYIYCTKGKPLMKTAANSCFIDNSYIEGQNLYGLYELVNGKVIGEFVCDKIYQYSTTQNCNGTDITDEEMTKASCLTKENLEAYEFSAEAKENCIYKIGVYGWHISDLVIYDKPRELIDFYVWKKCNACRDTGYESTACCYDEDCRVPAVITRPPQSWCYVEGI